eukprot:UN26277
MDHREHHKRSFEGDYDEIVDHQELGWQSTSTIGDSHLRKRKALTCSTKLYLPEFRCSMDSLAFWNTVTIISAVLLGQNTQPIVTKPVGSPSHKSKTRAELEEECSNSEE